MDKRTKTNTPFYRLRQKAPRALTVLERHRDEPVIELFTSTLVPTTQAFIEHFDATHAFEMARASKSAAQASSARHAWARTSVWLSFLARDVPEFDATAYTSDPGSPVSVTAAAERLLALVGNLEADGVQLPYSAQMHDDLTAAMNAATTHWNEARASLNELQTRQADTRTHAVAFERELIAFRRTLKVLLGASDSDYQSLRTTRRPSTTEPGLLDAPPLEAQTTPLPRTPALTNGAPAPLNGVSALLKPNTVSASTGSH